MSGDHEYYERRVETFRDALAARGLAGAIVSWAPHVRYLSGIVVESFPAFLIVDVGRVTAIVPHGTNGTSLPEIDVFPYENAAIEVEGARRNALAAVDRVLDRRGLKAARLGIEPDDLRAADLQRLPELRVASDIGPLLARQRMRKDAAEIERIRANLGVLATGFDAARVAIRPGATELAVWSAMHAAMMTAVGTPFVLEGNLASGPRALEDEPQATNRRLEVGDVVYIDLYPLIDGYAADLTRCFVVGQPAPEQMTRHAVLEGALAAGVAALKPGVRAGDVDGAVREYMATALGGYTFPHHAGHALGLQAQEPPMLIPGDTTIIEPGMVIAIEPGAYLPDTGGMRVEGNYLVTETGSLSLSDYPLALFACP